MSKRDDPDRCDEHTMNGPVYYLAEAAGHADEAWNTDREALMALHAIVCDEHHGVTVREAASQCPDDRWGTIMRYFTARYATWQNFHAALAVYQATTKEKAP